MLAKKYKSEIVSIENPLEGIYTIEFKSLGRKYKYLPGQFLHLAIDNDYDGIGQWPESRCFSMQSSPEEKNIKITYAVKGSFTSLMKDSLKEGDEVWLKLPYGDLFQQTRSKENAVFIAGGTGITPFLSLFTNESFKEYTSPHIYLGFRSKGFNIYQTELDRLEDLQKTVNYFYEDIDGKLNIESIFKTHGAGSNYFISGPPEMIKSFKNILINKGMPAENILTDDWE